MNKPFDILVAGEINPDLILSGNVSPEFGQVEKLVDSAELSIGSSSAIFASGVPRLGLKVAIIGVCGEDLFGRFMLDAMSARSVDVSNVIRAPGEQTGLSVILNRNGDRAILTHMGLIAALRASDISDGLLHQTRHLHVASYFLQTALQPGLPDLFRRAHSLSVTTSLDTNWDPSGNWKGIMDLLPLVDIFLPNAAEACAITGFEDIEGAAVELGKHTGIAAIKLGAQGALGVQGKRQIRVSSIPIAVVDTTGAGDSFNAGFIFGFLKEWKLEKSLKLAVACGALSTRTAGGTTSQPTLEEAMQYVD
jgi:sugar/nucleoside kinase (ribokinase family)